ncbi:hypothetical protein PSTT_00489 [Puccinia striiformis]|uniref:Flavodoxin-like domain-containing protein n=1 Tax=Puccinia striiformis TaxID=27350 RepID=A0A2S4W720_9BASI|nr:hypothetical protein PSTT_00489 [Puccinia striiformis]
MFSLSSTDLVLLSIIGALTLYWLYTRLFSDPSNSNKNLTNPNLQQQIPGFNNPNGTRPADSNPACWLPAETLSRRWTYRLCNPIAKEAKSKYGISSLVADPDELSLRFQAICTYKPEFHASNSEQPPLHHLQLRFRLSRKAQTRSTSDFVVATYGEGEPTDNARTTTEGNQLDDLNYVVFALGNRTYEQFCQMGIIIDDLLTKRGAKRLGELGMGDDDKSMEEDYLAWKDPMWEQVQQVMGWEEGAGGDEPDFLVKEVPVTPGEEGSIEDSQVYRGELSGRALMGTRGIFDAKNPCPPQSSIPENYLRRVIGTVYTWSLKFKELESDINRRSSSRLARQPGFRSSQVDEIAWSLGEACDSIQINSSSLDPMLAKVPFPTPASYEAIFRHYLDISCVASRQLISGLAKFAPIESASAALKAIGTDKEHYQRVVAGPGLRLGECLMTVLPGGSEMLSVEDPLSDNFGKGWFRLIRYLLIRLSAVYLGSNLGFTQSLLVQKCTPTKFTLPNRMIYGYFECEDVLHGEKERMEHQPIDQRADGAPHYTLAGPRGKYLEEGTKLKIPIHVRRSNFRLPTSPKIPVIMIGPGTESRRSELSYRSD